MPVGASTLNIETKTKKSGSLRPQRQEQPEAASSGHRKQNQAVHNRHQLVVSGSCVLEKQGFASKICGVFYLDALRTPKLTNASQKISHLDEIDIPFSSYSLSY